MGSKPRLSLKGQALKYLSMREHSRVELRRKMLPHARRACQPMSGPETGEVQAEANAVDAVDAADAERAADDVGPCLDKLLDWLEGHGLLSEERFVESRIRTRSARFGAARIRHELAQHGVSVPTDMMHSLDATEVERAREVWLRKFGGGLSNASAAVPADAADRARQMRFLAARGFSSEAVRKAVRGSRESELSAASPKPSSDAEGEDSD